MKQPVEKKGQTRLAFFISPHGFGHAARASSVIEALSAIAPSVQFDIFTSVPRWFFADSLSAAFSYHHCLTDIGMVQQGPLREDLSATIRHLNDFLPFDRSLIDHLAQQLKDRHCLAVLCDIAPMGIMAAQTAALPSILVENFTWDWIYEGYAAQDKRLNTHIRYLRGMFDRASCHIQTQPVCQHQKADFVAPPISREARMSREGIRRQMDIPVDAKVVLITMGGIELKLHFIDQLRNQPGVYFIVPGASQSMDWVGNLRLLPHHCDFFHPDLVNASDAVVGKLGYSTLAEVYHAGIPLGYVPRRHFRESGTLARFVETHMSGLAIDEADFQTGGWISQVPRLLALPRRPPTRPNGSQALAEYVLKRFFIDS